MASMEERYQALLQWVESAGGRLHPALEIYHDEITKGSFRVRENSRLEPDEELVSFPLSCSLSYLNAIAGRQDVVPATLPSTILQPGAEENTNNFPAEFLSNVPPHVVGRFFLIQQYLRRDASYWWPYVRTLPQPERVAGMLPVVWPTADAEFLRGTNAHSAVEEIRSTLKKEYKQAIKFMPEELRYEYTQPLYYWAYCIFTSRSFRPSLIIPDAQALSLPCAIDDFSILLPLYDIGNHSHHAKVDWATDADSRNCTLRSQEPYQAGQQVYNNYGMKTNAELLLGYGFVLPESDDFHNDYVHIKTRADAAAGDFKVSHIVSLRPFSHPSSLVGRFRLLDPAHLSCLPCFSHIQDSLVASLYDSITAGQGGAGGTPANATLSEILQGSRIRPEILEQIVNALGAKLAMDLESIELYEPQYEPTNQNQELALLYRRQCQKVLNHALASLTKYFE